MKFIPRKISKHLKNIVKQFPVMLLTGARQSGKSTLLQKLFSPYEYVSLDNIKIRQQATADPELFLTNYNPPLIIDEVQHIPDLLSYIKLNVDKTKTKGSYILTGSQQFSLVSDIHESLAGRAGTAYLDPFSIEELYFSKNMKIPFWTEICLSGLYPEPNTEKGINLNLWFSNYIDSILNKDIKNNLRKEHLKSYDHFIKLIATRTAQELKYSNISNELGVSSLTIQSWTGFLERSQLIYLLPPYYKNLGKRIVKSHKLYFLDAGLVAFLTGHRTKEQILDGPMSGQLFETLVVSEIVKYFHNRGEKPPIFYYRENLGAEVDLMLDFQNKVLLIEIKATSNVTKKHIEPLKKVQSLIPKSRAIVLCNISRDFYIDENILAINWLNISKFLNEYFN